jgi:Family of unknown function (DUF6350)
MELVSSLWNLIMRARPYYHLRSSFMIMNWGWWVAPDRRVSRVGPRNVATMSTMSHLVVQKLAPVAAEKARAPWLVAVTVAIWSVIAGLALCLVPVMAAWLAEGAEQPMAAPLRLGGRIWLVAQHTPLEVPTDTTINFMPWGLSLFLVLLAHAGGRWAARVSGVPRVAVAIRLTVVISAAYAAAAAAIALAVTSAEAEIDARFAALSTGIVALVSGGSGVLVESGTAARTWAALPPLTQTWLRAGATAAAALIAGGALLVVIALGVHAGRIGPLTTSLSSGVVGGLLVTLLGVILIPNAVVWATAYALGPGFVVGFGTAVSPGDIRLGPVPGLPILAGLPTETRGVLGWLVLLIPLAAGVLTGHVVYRSHRDRALPWRLLDSTLAGGVAGVLIGVLSAVSGGSAGPGRLAEVGAPPLITAFSAAAEIALVSGVTSVVLAWRSRRASPEASG